MADNDMRLVKFSQLHNGKNRTRHSPAVSKVSFSLKGTVLFVTFTDVRTAPSGWHATKTRTNRGLYRKQRVGFWKVLQEFLGWEKDCSGYLDLVEKAVYKVRLGRAQAHNLDGNQQIEEMSNL